MSRADSPRLKLPLRESTSRLWRKARGDLSVPERIHESLERIRKVSHAVATATAWKGDRGRRSEGEARGRMEGKGSTGTLGLDFAGSHPRLAHTILVQTAMRIFCRRRRRRRRPTHDISADTGARRAE